MLACYQAIQPGERLVVLELMETLNVEQDVPKAGYVGIKSFVALPSSLSARVSIPWPLDRVDTKARLCRRSHGMSTH